MTEAASAAEGNQQPTYNEAMQTMSDGTSKAGEPAVGLHARVMPRGEHGARREQSSDLFAPPLDRR